MKTLKKAIVTIVILGVLLAIIVPFLVAPIVNNINLSEIEKEVVNKPLPSKVSIKQDSFSEYGHLSGNDDTVEYFSSIVITTDVAYDVLTQHYAGCVVLPLTSYTFQPEGKKDSVIYTDLQDRADYNNLYVIYKFTPADISDFMGLLGSWDKTL